MKLDDEDQKILDEFAGKAMQGLVNNSRYTVGPNALQELAADAYEVGKAMMRERHRVMFEHER